jgi:cytochrome c-type biogenesis protein CcmH
MRRWLPLLVAAGVAAIAAVVLLLVTQPPVPVARADQARALAAELRCPDCESLSVAESRTAAAAAIRAEIHEQLAAGRSPADIRATFVARYGEWILLQPTSPLIWSVPILALLAGAGLLGWWLLGRSAAPPVPPVAAASEERQRVREEAELLDG